MTLGARWAIVLAAGEGSRLRVLTTDAAGVTTPKQFCSLRGGASLLERTLARAERVVPRERVVVVVAAEHERFWRGQLAHLPARNVVVQPKNRGTAIGILLPLLTIMQQDSEPDVLLLPSDHFVADETTLVRSLHAACDVVAGGETGLILLGMRPDAPTADYGWIVPVPGSDVAPVHAFVEKPPPATASTLMARGALWNTFLMAARGRSLRGLVDHAAPGLVRRMEDALRITGDAVDRLYELLTPLDLSRDVLQRVPEALRVIAVPSCGWTDLGTPQRVRACLRERGVSCDGARVMHRGVTTRLDLLAHDAAGA